MFRTIVSAAEVEAHLGDDAWVVFDCRHTLADFTLGRRQYNEAHVPGAFFADVETDLAGEKNGKNGRHPMPDPEVFASFLRSCGVSDRTQIVAYDAGADMGAARLWFLSRWIGHAAVAVLDGGFAAWSEAVMPVTADATASMRTGNLRVRLQDDMIVAVDYVQSHLHDDGVRLLDARAADRFAGHNEIVDPVAGHIPSAKNHWFKQNFNERGLLKDVAELRAIYERFGSPSQLVHQCGSGVSAAVNALAMEHAGLPGSRLYAGSWSEWIADPGRPIATGEPPA